MSVKLNFEFDQKNKVKKPTDKGLLQLRSTANRKRKYFTTRISILQSQWNEKNERVVRHPQAEQFNQQLDDMIFKINSAQRKAELLNEVFNLENVKDRKSVV